MKKIQVFENFDTAKKVLQRRKGYMCRGSEPLGCYNSGLAPAIKHLLDGGYLVGFESSVRAAYGSKYAIKSDNAWFWLRGKKSAQINGRKVSYHKTIRTAWTEFEQLETNRQIEIAEERAIYHKNLKRANSDNPIERMNGALGLMDYI